jgi:putative molybdopterin biosynthesis protein
VEYLKRVQNLEHIKILSDARRMAILRLLMAEQATLSQLGKILGEHPAQIRHHLKLLEGAGLVELSDSRVVRGFVEKYYRARARAFLLQELILPEGDEANTLTILGSHDLALETLSAQLRSEALHSGREGALRLLLLPVGSLDGLVALRQGIAQMAGCHLLDVESGDYNLPFVRHLFPDRPVRLVTLAHRQQGLLISPGNPLKIHRLEDLARKQVLMINRNRGSGTRLWLDRQLAEHGLAEQLLRGYEREVRTHTAVAEAIGAGRADAGLGLLAAAQKYGLDFIPLFEERFDLATPQEQIENPLLAPFFDALTSARFRRAVEGLGGYQTAHTGDELLP